MGDLLAHAVADLLRDAGHEPALHEVARGACQVEAEQEQQGLADPVKVHGSGAAHLGDKPLVELGSNLAQHLGAHDVEDDRADGKGNAEEHGHLVLAHVAQQLQHGALEVLGLLDGASAAEAAAAHGAALALLGHDGLGVLVCH